MAVGLQYNSLAIKFRCGTVIALLGFGLRKFRHFFSVLGLCQLLFALDTLGLSLIQHLFDVFLRGVSILIFLPPSTIISHSKTPLSSCPIVGWV